MKVRFITFWLTPEDLANKDNKEVEANDVRYIIHYTKIYWGGFLSTITWYPASNREEFTKSYLEWYEAQNIHPL